MSSLTPRDTLLGFPHVTHEHIVQYNETEQYIRAALDSCAANGPNVYLRNALLAALHEITVQRTFYKINTVGG